MSIQFCLGNLPLELAFSTKTLRDICESEVLIYQLFEAGVAKRLISRLADLHAANDITQLPTGNPKPTLRNSEEHMQIELTKSQLITICANHIENPTHADNSIDWEKVSRIKICSIGDYDG